MAFYYLLLGHLLGDFVLQTDKIAANKGKYWQWNLLHVSIVTVCMLVSTFIFGPISFLMVLANGLLHFLLDYYKPAISKLLRLPELAGFIIDQSLHILFLYLISFMTVTRNPGVTGSIIVKLLIVLVVLTSFSAVFTQFVLAAVFPRTGSGFFEDGEKFMGILSRIFITTVFYLSYIISPFYLFLLILVPAAFVIQFKYKWNKWMSPTHLLVKFLLDALISTAAILLILSI